MDDIKGIAEKTNLEKLSHSLSDEERIDLLEKINRSAQTDEDDEYIVQVELEKEEKNQIINEEIRKLSWWVKFIIWIKCLVTGRTKKQVFLRIKLKQIKKKIKKSSPGLTGFETRDFTAKFARYVYNLYFAAFSLIDLFEKFTDKSDFIEKAFSYIIEKKSSDTKRDITDFITNIEMEEIFEKEGTKEAIKKALLKNFYKYMKSIPSNLFKKIQEEFKPFFYLKSIVLFPYGPFFTYFDYYIGEELDKKYPFFKSAPAIVMLDLIEKLFYAVYTGVNVQQNSVFQDQILFTYVLDKKGISNRDTDGIEESIEEIQKESAAIRNDLYTLALELENFNKTILLNDILKYFKNDPYYKLKFYLPRISIKSIFSSALKRRLIKELDEKFIQIKKNVIDKRLIDIFKDINIVPLSFYVEIANNTFQKSGLPYFAHIKSLTLLYNYIRSVYKEYIQEVLQILNQYLVMHSKRSQVRLVNYASNIEELEDKIFQFDHKLSHDEEDGKTLIRVKYNITTDLTHQKLYKSFVSEKDKDARHLIEKGVENLSGLRNIFDETLNSPADNIKESLKTLTPFRGKQQTLANLLNAQSQGLSDFITLINQVLDMEKGY